MPTVQHNLPSPDPTLTDELGFLGFTIIYGSHSCDVYRWGEPRFSSGHGHQHEGFAHAYFERAVRWCREHT